MTAFRQGVRETGYVEGQNVAIEYRWAQDQYDRLPDLAADLVRRQVAVIAAHDTAFGNCGQGGDHDDPDRLRKRRRPGQARPRRQPQPAGWQRHRCHLRYPRSLGQSSLGSCMSCCREPRALACWSIPTLPITEPFVSDVRAAASAIGKQIEVLDASTGRDIDTVFASLAQKPVDALLVGPGPLFNNRRVQLVTLAAYHRVPAIYALRESAEAGGLMSYGASITDAYRQAGVYTGRILKGEKPADLPVMQSTKFEFVINLNTAKAFGLELSA